MRVITALFQQLPLQFQPRNQSVRAQYGLPVRCRLCCLVRHSASFHFFADLTNVHALACNHQQDLPLDGITPLFSLRAVAAAWVLRCRTWVLQASGLDGWEADCLGAGHCMIGIQDVLIVNQD